MIDRPHSAEELIGESAGLISTSNSGYGMRYSDLSTLKQSYVDYCVAYSQFRIRESMSISEISRDVETYEQLRAEEALGPYGYANLEMVEIGRELCGGEQEYMDVCRLIETILDEWLRSTPSMPLSEIGFPPAG